MDSPNLLAASRDRYIIRHRLKWMKGDERAFACTRAKRKSPTRTGRVAKCGSQRIFIRSLLVWLDTRNLVQLSIYAPHYKASSKFPPHWADFPKNRSFSGTIDRSPMEALSSGPGVSKTHVINQNAINSSTRQVFDTAILRSGGPMDAAAGDPDDLVVWVSKAHEALDDVDFNPAKSPIATMTYVQFVKFSPITVHRCRLVVVLQPRAPPP